MSKTHGKTHTYEFKKWRYMVNRCRSKDEHTKKYYGDKKVASEWLGPDGFMRFLKHIGPAPSAGHTIDRKDNSKGYAPGNVRWATRLEQARNRRNNRTVTALGRTQCIAEWSEQTGVSPRLIWWRLGKGWPEELAVTQAARSCVRRHVGEAPEEDDDE